MAALIFQPIISQPALRGRTFEVLGYLLDELDIAEFRMIKQAAVAHLLGMRQPHVARSLRVLLEHDLLQEGPRDGRCCTYRLNPAHPVSRVVYIRAA